LDSADSDQNIIADIFINSSKRIKQGESSDIYSRADKVTLAIQEYLDDYEQQNLNEINAEYTQIAIAYDTAR
jgi:hypothetical protein